MTAHDEATQDSDGPENVLDTSAERYAWAYLNRVIEGPSQSLWQLLRAGRDCTEIARGIRRRASWLHNVLKQTEARHSWCRWEEDLEIARRYKARLVTPDDEEFPRETFASAFNFAELGASRGASGASNGAAGSAPPHGLWVRGGNLRELVQQSVAIVGTRAMSEYGRAATEHLVRDLSPAQWTVISGGALGIDTAAHSAAVAAGGSTVVISACGIDSAYPRPNVNLFNTIAGTGTGNGAGTGNGHGALVTEYPPETSPQRHRFLTRNRLVAALTEGTVVVEAAWRSGALNTLHWAEGFGKTTMAVPGPVTTVGSLGCHQLLKDGRAQLITSAEDIRELLGGIGEVDATGQYELQFGPNPIQQLSRNELRVYDCVPPHGYRAKEAEDIATDAGMPLGLTVHLLLDLHKAGLLAREGGAFTRTPNHD